MHPRGTDTPNFPQKLIKIIENFNQKLTPKRGGGGGVFREDANHGSLRKTSTNTGSMLPFIYSG